MSRCLAGCDVKRKGEGEARGSSGREPDARETHELLCSRLERLAMLEKGELA